MQFTRIAGVCDYDSDTEPAPFELLNDPRAVIREAAADGPVRATSATPAAAELFMPQWATAAEIVPYAGLPEEACRKKLERFAKEHPDCVRQIIAYSGDARKRHEDVREIITTPRDEPRKLLDFAAAMAHLASNRSRRRKI